MSVNTAKEYLHEKVSPFFEQPQVQVYKILVGEGVPFGIEQVSHPLTGIGGAYGTWGKGYDNTELVGWIEQHFGEPLPDEERINLAPLGFLYRHHTAVLSMEEHLEVEVEVGARMLRAAAQACGWKPEEVEGVLIGMTCPIADNYTELIARKAGIPESALKVSVHKACDGSSGALHLSLNPNLEANRRSYRNIAESLYGKKVLTGGIEGLSRCVGQTHDKNGLQLFGNGAGIIGIIPGETMKFLVGKAHEVYDEKGFLAVKMFYPHSGHKAEDGSMLEVSQAGKEHIRVAGLMHEPADGAPVEMAGPTGMVKLFVRTGVKVVREVYQAYKERMKELGIPGKELAAGVVHHANYKICQLKTKHLKRAGINISLPWVLSEFGNVSAASNMIAFLRQLPSMKPGDHILMDGFGAGTYYDVLAVELGGG